MKEVFSKTFSLKAPGGDGYEWKKAETAFQRNTYKVNMAFFDVYDFSRMDVPQSFWPVKDFLKTIINNGLDRGETIDVIQNYEIEIHINEVLTIH